MIDQLEIPDFLRRTKKNELPKTKLKAAKKIVTKASVAIEDELPMLPEGIRYAVSASEEAGSHLREGVLPRRWAGDALCAAMLAKEIRDRREKKERSFDEFKAAMAEKKKSEPPKVKVIFGLDLKMTVLKLPKAGTKFGDRLAEAQKYVTKNKRSSVAEVLEKTNLSRSDYDYAVKKGLLKIDLLGGEKK